VGVDGSPADAPAVRFAFEQARPFGVPIVALHAWTHPASTGSENRPHLVDDPAGVQVEPLC